MKYRRVKTPTVIQMEAVECGAASLAIILGYFHKNIPLEELRVACGVSRDGSNAQSILSAAQSYGLEGAGLKSELADLDELKLPFIIFWEFNHFLVVEGFSKKEVWLNDPAYGPRRVSYEEFDQKFTGIVLTLEPGENFKPDGHRRSLLTVVRGLISGSEVVVGYAVLSGLALVLVGLAIPAFGRAFVDNYLVGGNQEWLTPLLIGMLLTAFMRGALMWVQSACLLKLQTKMTVASSARCFWRVLRLPMVFFNQRAPGDITNRISVNEHVSEVLAGPLARVGINLLMVVFLAACMASYDLSLTLIGIVAAAINLILTQAVKRKIIDGNLRVIQAQNKAAGFGMNSISNIESLKASSTELDAFSRLTGYQAKCANYLQELTVQAFLPQMLPNFIALGVQGAILFLGGMRVMKGELTMGMLVAFQSLMTSFLTPIKSLVDSSTLFRDMEANLDRLEDIKNYDIDRDTEDVLPSSPHAGRKLSGRVQMENITFGHSLQMDPLIQNFSVRLEPGSRVALVGGSGSGKSTLAKILCGLAEPWQGEILFDGLPRTKVPRAIRSTSIAFVDQDIVLFDGTIRDNLTLWDTTIPEEQMIEAAKDALIHGEILRRKGGYDGRVEQGGRNFSGGQRQRLEIARALATLPRILVLDEATSALDPITEKIIDENIRRRGCTCLIVAHRLSTIRDSDEILVLQSGQVVQRGTHPNLLQDKEGLYAQLIATA